MKALKNPTPKIITHTLMDGKIDSRLLGKIITYLLLSVFMISCADSQGKQSKHIDIKSDYCIVNDSYNEMHLKFKISQDTTYMFYSNIIDNGSYLNDYDDSTDFAGYFITKDIIDSVVTFNIKSYRDITDIYVIKLTFHNNGEKIDWIINSPKQIAYLPVTAHFNYCSNDASFAEVIVEKCPLYKDSTTESLTKGYLVKGDYVEILNKKGGWVNIKYTSSEQKNIVRWIKADCIGIPKK